MKNIQKDIDSHPDPDARARLTVAYRKMRGSVFDNVTKVCEHLVKRGYDVGKSKVYGDVKKGYLRKQADDTVFQVDVEEYILVGNRGGPLKIKTDSAKADLNDIALKNKEEEFKGLQLKNEKLEIEVKKLRGDLISRDEAEADVVDNANLLSNLFTNMVRTSAHEWLLQSKNEPRKLIDMIEGDLKEMCDELAKRGEIKVVYESETSQQAA